MGKALTLRLEKIRSEAYRTFGPEYSQKWLRSSSRYFNYKTPLDFAKDEKRADKVLEHINFYEGASIA